MMRTEQNIQQILSPNINDSFHKQNFSHHVISPSMHVQNVQNPVVNQSFHNNKNENFHLQQNSNPQI